MLIQEMYYMGLDEVVGIAMAARRERVRQWVSVSRFTFFLSSFRLTVQVTTNHSHTM